MIPQKLSLRNFMSYGDEAVEVDFDGLHLACLSGGNGHGKSALLDAMTWALWGRSRAKREDDLVRQGATEMQVEFAFNIGAGYYRVLRKRSVRSGGGKASLELQALGEGGYTSITGATIAETQARLNEILKLGYETFINSSFLLQGRADEFTVKPPAQRKEVLGEILGLDRYEKLAERARERYKTLDMKARTIKEGMASLENELSRRPVIRAELDTLARDHAMALQALDIAESALKAAQAERQALAAVERSLDAKARTSAALRDEIKTLQERHDAAARVVSDADDLLAHEPSILAGVAELRQERAALDEMGARAGRVMELQPLVERCRQEIESARSALRSTVQCADEEEQAFMRTAAELPTLLAHVSENEAAEALIPATRAERAEVTMEAQKVRHQAGLLESENARLAAEMEPLRERLRLLNERGAACPVCGTPMNEAERRRVYEQFKREGLDKQAQHKANEARLADLNRDLARLEEHDKQLGATLDGLDRKGRELVRLRQAVQQSEAAAAEARAARVRRENAQRALANDDFAPEARARLVKAESEVRAVGYDRERHAALRDRAAQLETMEAAAAELATARERKAAALLAQSAADNDLERRQTELKAAEDEAADLRAALATLEHVEARLKECEATVVDSRRRADEIDRLAVAKREVLRMLDELEHQLSQKRSELGDVEREAGAFAELTRAFGKKGIQAMIIDTALPELEHRANAILTSMTNGELQVQFSTQAQSTRGDLLETLDIKLADAGGTRPYEMFSGGEAFRANFAIRVALSRLLAERAGAQLQLLVIDEGFGTQDSQGRERLVEAINSIAPDFEKIVVITHIDELKDQFSARIDVVKGLGGSRVSVTV